MTNPLLEYHRLPPFKNIQPSHVDEAITELTQKNLQRIDALLAKTPMPHSWQDLILPLEEWEDELSQAWSAVSHLNSVANTPELRSAYHTCLPKLTDYSNKIGQNQLLYSAYIALKESDQFNNLDPAQQKMINDAILDFKLAGVGLVPDEREKFAALNQELSQLQNTFQDNVMDATDGWFLTIKDSHQLAGLSEQTIALAKQVAEKNKEEGWRLTLDYPCYSAVMTYAEDRNLRRQMHEAYFTRASEIGPQGGKCDNTQIMERILAVRHEMANLLGYHSYAEKSLAKKMAKTPDEVMEFLKNLASKAKPYAEKEWQALQAFAKEEYGVQKCEPWDVAFYSEKLRQKKYAISQEDLRVYFPTPVVLTGLFEVVKRLYGLSIVENKDTATWHPDVQFFEIFDENKQRRGMFYLDLYARAQKRGGAWMDEGRVKRKRLDGAVQDPVAYLVCNFREPIGNSLSLLTHDDVLTLFHEFGHGLHHMLTKIEYPSISGINGVPWDVVEVPSQFMENWCWQSEALSFISSHYQTKEPLSKEWLDKMHKARNFQSAMMLIRQLEMALFDFRIHLEYSPASGGRIYSILQKVKDEVSVTPQAPYARFAHSFSHIFAGGYAAGYYSYLWAEVLSCDAFSKFKEEGIFNRTTGKAFLEKVLEIGGSIEPQAWFQDFRGRPPQLDAFLHDHGLSN